MKPVYAFTFLAASLAVARPAPIPQHAVEARNTGLVARAGGLLQKVERKATDFLSSFLEAANEDAGFIGNGTKHHGHQGHNGTHHGHRGHHNGTLFNGTFGIEYHGNHTRGSMPSGIASALLALSTGGAHPEHRHNGTDGEHEHHHHNGTEGAEPTGIRTHSHHSHSAVATSSAAVEKRQDTEATPTASFSMRFPSGSGFPQHSGHARPTGAFPSGFPSGAALSTGFSHSGFPSGASRPTGHHSHSSGSFPSGVAMPTGFPAAPSNGTGDFKDALAHFFGRLAHKA